MHGQKASKYNQCTMMISTVYKGRFVCKYYEMYISTVYTYCHSCCSINAMISPTPLEGGLRNISNDSSTMHVVLGQDAS
jgi:hypothetical protein